MRLYLDDLPGTTKEAGFSARLSDNVEQWPQELSSELLKQLPYLSDYDMAVNLDRVEKERGFAFGYADVANRTERPEEEHGEAGLPHVRIPLIITERGVKPFTVYLDGERASPLTEERLREALFNPTAFDLSTSQPHDPSMVDNLMPPNRNGGGGGGEIDVKTASVKSISLLRAIAPTIGERDVERFVEKVASDPSLIAGFRRAGISGTLVDVFEKTARTSPEDRLEALAENILPTVVTMQKLPGGDFLVKQAASNAFAGGKAAKGQVVSKDEAAQAIGPQNAQAMQPGQTATAVADPVQVQAEAASKAKVVEEFGEFQVQDMLGNKLLGWVFPQCVAWDGEFSPQQIALFTNGSVYAFQDAVAGELVGKGTNLPVDKPLGEGVFYTVDRGEAICTTPVTIGSSAAGPDGQPILVGQDLFGTQVHITIQDGLKEPMRISDMEYALPSTWKFMRINNQTQLIQDPGQMNKIASVKAAASSVTLFWNGTFNLEGGCGLPKIAKDFRYDLDPVNAEFMLGVLGVDGVTAKQKLAEARRKGHVKLAGLRKITTLGERFAGSTKVASALAAKMPNLRRDLVKEAASLQDEGTIDTLLALNFVNPENLHTFIDELPKLETTSDRLAEMLLLSYLGQNELPEQAVERAMKGLDEVISGLKSVQHANAEI